jgi:hypothetical protein
MIGKEQTIDSSLFEVVYVWLMTRLRSVFTSGKQAETPTQPLCGNLAVTGPIASLSV